MLIELEPFVPQELDAHRDRATSLALELEDVKTALDAKEREIEELLADLDERDQVQREEVQRVAEEWREEVEEAKDREREARQVRACLRLGCGSDPIVPASC